MYASSIGFIRCSAKPAAFDRYIMPAGRSAAKPPAVAVVNRWYRRTDARPLQNLGLGLEEASLDKKPACIQTDKRAYSFADTVMH